MKEVKMDISSLGIASVAAITVVCYLICQLIKATPLDNKWLPVIAGVSGAALGVVAMYVMPDYPANDYITAVAVGIVSGLAATGINQVYKQLTQ
jgi:hypothetical protein